MSITIQDAEAILAGRANGNLEGISTGKGGRAWLDGEWQLDELEALCVKIRHQCIAEGHEPHGAQELIDYWKEQGI